MKLRWLMFLALFVSTAFAEPISQLKPTGYVNDFARVLDAGTASRIGEMCRQVDEKAHAQIALVTINTLDGSDIESYAVDLFHQWGIGAKSTDRGVLILYVIRDHRARIEVGYGLEPILPDGKVGGFQREALPLMRSGNYSQGLELVTTRVADVIAADAGIQLAHSPAPAEPVQEQDRERPGVTLSLGKIILIIIVILIVLLTPLRSLLFWMLFSNIFDGRGGWGGGRGGGFGGFGGGGGGGGFGGFGGGSSGGGGASSSW